ncbi:MAG: murein transglycosylase A [Alphaproteobacteria bacterium]|nr:murein transglycosylase A [Alphaproteobacteria bacterium]MBU0792360.1 murein transglycosylase A [Alphaproteobacteria bacterium]MBU0877573.1 murein transglycosylase A [Alphaproteobacteria bacterium]MBU1770040.1 murein transglycosylase A [Alphaproteobacteria bacterium]
MPALFHPRLKSFAALASALMLAACGSMIPPGAPGQRPVPSAPATPPKPATPRPPLTPAPAPAPDQTGPGPAVAAGLTPGPAIDTVLPASSARMGLALRAFQLSCPSLLRRRDQSGLTGNADWQTACAAAASWSEANAREFFRRYFEAVQVGDGKAFATGYYEPEIAGCRNRAPGCETPIYRKPGDLIEVDLGLFSESLKGRRIRGKVQGSSFVPYDDRAAITSGALAGRGLELGYAVDPVELFFLEVQGSGRVRLPDGSIMRIGYAGQNGRDYTGIGRLMRDRGLIQIGSMQDIMGWLRANPVEGRAIMNENKSYVFFQELTGPGPLGALGLPVTPEVTVAADPEFVPLGAPVLLSLDRAEPNGLWIAQDTGGAIKGSNRFDTFWGAGERARGLAGGMSARGSALILLPIGTYARLTAGH